MTPRPGRVKRSGGSGTQKTPPAFTEVRSESLPSQIRAQLEDAIARGNLQPGERLPSERSLAEQFRVSRVAVREALRLMEATGVVDVRSGLGTYISRSAGDKLRDGWITWLRAHHDETVEIIAVRKALEQLAASRAANNATPNDIGKLESICDTFERELGKSTPNQRRLADLDIAFHRQIAQIGGGIIIPRLVDEVASVIGRSRRITFAHPGPARAVAADHRRILAAIAAHDPEQAAEALAAHMETIIETLTNLAKGTP